MRMKQSIVAVIRPRLNLSQKESEASHLIEHILTTPKRLKKMGISANFYADNIIYNGGIVNDFYLAEYYIVKSESAGTLTKVLSKYQNNLFPDHADFEKIKSTLIEELHENRGEFISRGEQQSRAIFLPGSPTVRNPWDNLESIVNISFDETINIFHKYNSDLTFMQLSYDTFKINKLPLIERNTLCAPNQTIELSHPWESLNCTNISQIVPLPHDIDFVVAMIYRRSLTDLRFGLLQDKLRHKQGMVYDISIDTDYNNNTSEIYFSSSEENSGVITNIIKQSLKKYEQFINKNIGYIVERLILEFELDWGNIQNSCLEVIDRVISGGITETPVLMIKKIKSVTPQDLSQFNHLFLNSLNHEAITLKCRYGKKLTTLFK